MLDQDPVVPLNAYVATAQAFRADVAVTAVRMPRIGEPDLTVQRAGVDVDAVAVHPIPDPASKTGAANARAKLEMNLFGRKPPPQFAKLVPVG